MVSGNCHKKTPDILLKIISEATGGICDIIEIWDKTISADCEADYFAAAASQEE